MNSFTLTRRQTLAGLTASTALTLGGCATTGTPRGRPISMEPDAWLDQVAYGLLEHEPERATGLGVDTGEYAGLRGKLEDQSIAGQRAYAAYLRWVVDQMEGIDESGMTADQQTGYQVVRSAFSTAVEGFDLPYGDVAVGSWRNAPYVVIQNVGSYLDFPRFMDSTHPLETQGDVDDYVSRLEGMPAVFDGELERIQAARAMGVVPPDFLIEKALGQMNSTLGEAQSGKLFVAQLMERAEEKGFDSGLEARVRPLVTGPIANALERQRDELLTQLGRAKSAPGMWAQPGGEEWYRWGLKASTTTTLSPDEIHEQGLEELESLHARMDPILREIGYDSGSVGERIEKNQLTLEELSPEVSRIRKDIESRTFEVHFRPFQILSEEADENVLQYDRCVAGFFNLNLYEDGSLVYCAPHRIPVGHMDDDLDQVERNIVDLSTKLDLSKCPGGCRYHPLNHLVHTVVKPGEADPYHRNFL